MGRSGVGVGEKIREMQRIVGLFEKAGYEVAELRGLLASALAAFKRGEDWRGEGARGIELCEALAASVPLEGAALRSAVVRVLGADA